MGTSVTIQHDFQAIESIVRGWGSSNSILLFDRLTTFLETEPCLWVYPWLK
jgi:hypothetical protein